ncbi:BREX-1 system phosphatase PglZ type A [Pollutimonas nitritireducens]|uniref:BREX-1 system phosphatase PglZ type A n=1 Tax=Pollutimonas nitritireducens TaxID=2045209 RepID=UPI001E31A140|nr:BREX-1 system phosphatase PglZ type A [Pollutimonas nitritireducens]
MTNPKIAQALTNLFGKQRIVFWYDLRHEFRADFETLELLDVQKIELANNEFTVKYRVLREQPEQKFLLYRDGAQPADLDNWLLDVQLASGSDFRTDQVALWLAELELAPDLYPVLQEHSGFFDAAKRREALQSKLDKNETPTSLRRKILAACISASTEPRLDVILEQLLAELADGRDEKLKLINRSGLGDFLWQQAGRIYGYESSSPGLRDFVIELFKSCFQMETDPEQKPKLSSEALVFLKRWKDSRTHETAFEALSEECADVLQIADTLHKHDFRNLLELDYFELIDRKILSDLVHAVAERTASVADVIQWARQRRLSHWFSRYKHEYGAVEVAAEFFQTLEATQLEISSLADGVKKYANHWYRLDQLYRKFIYHLRESGQASLLGELNTLLENQYTNNYLTKLNNGWQRFVDDTQQWQAPSIVLQRDFFQHYVQPFLDRKAKVCVLISDAFRYEIGEELQSLIRQEDRFDAELHAALSLLPSYTQLGMAALLPNQSLSLADNDTGAALVNGLSAQGTENRSKILTSHVPASAVVQAKDLMTMGRDESRALVRDNEVVYVYHNLIDKTGDTRDTEERVFAAAHETLQELIRLIKKLTNANASNLLITADHGFIYQNRPLDESEFLTSEPQGEQIQYRDRRFVLGKGLRENDGFKHFTSEQLGLTGALEVQIPKSIKRLRLKGSGSRFVHGGATLQEVVIPVIRVNKKRQSDVSRVDVEFIGGGNKTITTGQLAVVLYQSQAVTDKLQARTLRIGLYTVDGELISDQHELNFDYASDNPRERELPVRLILGRKADEANNQQVVLKLEEQIDDTTHYREYKSQRYTIRRSFTSEFDF